MEKYLQFTLNTEEAATGESFAADDAPTFHSTSAVGFPALQSITQNRPLLPLLSNRSQTTSFTSDPSHIFNLFSIASEIDPHSMLHSFDSISNTMELKTPKTETDEIDSINFNQVSLTPSTFNEPPPPEYNSISSLFQLPNLYEFFETDSQLVTTESPPRPKKLKPASSNLYGNNNQVYSNVESTPSPSATEGVRLKYLRQREVSRQRRKRLREKIECLKQLLPSEKRMDTATVLDNTCKYIKFLEAQVRVLEAMPHDCLYEEVNNIFSLINGGGGTMRMMKRNELLQSVVNSAVTQEILSSRGMCVYSTEQVVQMIDRLFTTEEAFLILNSFIFSSFTSL